MGGLIYKFELLQQIAAAVNKLNGRTKLMTIEVTFKTDVREYIIGDLSQALDVIANDMYWDDRGDWSKARVAEVRTI